MIEVKKKEGESVNAFIFRFTKKIQQSGVLKESKRRRFKSRKPNKRAVKVSAIYRSVRKVEVDKLRKLGKGGRR
ncbi:MAG: 30S ribosomal protein S21 [Candidatus Paceibacterota bacterium]|jgi:ribosomal protein S21